MYDVRKLCTVPGLCYDFSNAQKFLNLPVVLEVGPARYCLPSQTRCCRPLLLRQTLGSVA